MWFIRWMVLLFGHIAMLYELSLKAEGDRRYGEMQKGVRISGASGVQCRKKVELRHSDYAV